MTKLNLICAAVAALFAAGVQAGSATSTPVSVATESFGSTATSALVTTGAPITYSMGGITAVNGGSTVYFTVRLTGGRFVGTPVIADFTFGGVTCGTGGVACVVTPSTDRTTVKVAVTPTTTTTLGLGAFAYTPAAGAFDTVNTVLNTVGGKISASIGLTSLNPASIEAAAIQANVDGALGVGDLAVAARAVTPLAAAPTSTVRIDLTASPAGSVYTAGANARAPLARVRFTTATGVKAANQLPAGADYALTGNTALATTLSLASGTFPIGAVVRYYDAADCLTLSTGTNTGVTIGTGNAAGPITVTLTNTPSVVTGVDQFLCMSAPSTGNTANPITPAISAVVTPATATDTIGTASGTGYNLQFNGSSVDVLTYWPGALDAFSYKGYLRITNTGSVAAAISAQHLTTSGALTGTATVLNIPSKPFNGTLAAGQSILLSSKQIDDLIGANPSNLESGRIRITAPTDGLRVQALLQTGNDAPIEYRANNGN